MDKYDEMLAELEKQKQELTETQEKIKEAKRISQSLLPKCGNCQHYHPHFVPSTYPGTGQIYFTNIRSGHCVYPRNKRREETDVCQHFEPRTQKVTDKYRFFFCTHLTNTLR